MDRLTYSLIHGEALDSISEMPSESIQCIITSPPYWNLRDYGVDTQLGVEKTPSEYVDRLVGIFRESKRVLRSEGTLWLNLGDTYAVSGSAGGGSFERERKCWGDTIKSKRLSRGAGRWGGGNASAPGLKAKDLIGIPWLVAFALQKDGWYLRQDVIWSKTNAMPESVKDRCTRSHEYLFLLSKNEKYYYNSEAIKEPAVCLDKKKWTDGGSDKQRGHPRRHAGFNGRYAEKIALEGAPTKRNKRSVWTIPTKPFRGAHFAVMPEDLVEPCVLAGSKYGDTILDPFSGSGTVGVVALKNGRRFVGIDVNSEYIEIARKRIGDKATLPLEGAA